MGGLKIIVLFGVFLTTTRAGYVKNISPNTGSLAGGTRITIFGTGFARSQFNFMAAANVGNTVRLATKTSSHECDIHKDGCNPTQIMCYTRRMPAGDYYVRVTVDGRVFADNEYPDSDPWSSKCRFRVDRGHTPLVYTVTPPSDIPESVVSLEGRLFSDLYGTNVDLSSNGRPERMRRANIGSDKFDVVDPTKEDKPDIRDEFYGYLVGENPSDTDLGYMKGRNTGSYVGNSNISFILDGYFGRSLFESLALTSDNGLTTYQTYAVIDSVSPSTGSTKGKTKLSIIGKYFDETDAKAVVLIAGTPCAVDSVADELIVCYTDKEPSSLPTVLYGNRGLTVNLWTGSTQYADDLANMDSFPAPDATNWTDGAHYIESNSSTFDEFVVKLSGYFIAPVDGDYIFLIRGSDKGVLMFNDGSSTAQVAAFNSKTTGYWEDTAQSSSVFSLTANTSYYIEARGKAGADGANLKVGAFIYNTVYTSTHTSNAFDETQQIEMTSTVIKEQQTLTFNNIASQTPTNEVQTLSIDSAGLLGGQPFRICLSGACTVKLTKDSSVADVETAINQLPNVAPDKVAISVTTTATGLIYTVQFNSDRGSWHEISAEVSTNDATISTTRTTPGVPSLKTFCLHFDGSMTGPIPVTSSAKEVKTALLIAKGVRCPSWLTKPPSKVLTTDFESPMPPMQFGSMTSDVMPFCGSTSIKNTQWLFYDNWSKPAAPRLSASTARYVCYAFNGKFQDKIKLHYNYTEGGVNRRRHTELKLSENIVGTPGTWNYRCIDMYTLIKNFHDNKVISNVIIWYIRIFPVTGSKDNFVDTVYIGSKELVPANELKELDKVILKPTAWNVKDIDVQGDFTSSLTVTITARDCAHNFSFIGVHGAESSESGLTSVFTSSNWPATANVTVTKVTEATPPIGGTFSITYDGLTVAGFYAGMLADAFKARLESLSNIGGVGVTLTGTCSTCKWKIQWLTDPGNHPEMSIADSSSLTGNNVAVAVTTKQNGGILLNPIPGDMLRCKHTEPQVQISINNVPSRCRGTCSFQWSSAATPTFTSVAPTSGAAGITLTLTGTGFSTTPGDNIVSVGNTLCVTASSPAPTSTQLECVLGQGKAGTSEVHLNVIGKGKTDQASIQFTSTFAVTTISPVSGSLGGGSLLTLTGTGFGDSVTVSLGGNSCKVKSASYTSIVCLTPAGSAGAVDVIASEGANSHTASVQFTYDASLTSVVNSISPDTAGWVQGGKVVTITGTGFGSTPSSGTPVSLNNVTAPYSSYSDTEIVVTLPALPAGSYPLAVATTSGLATLSGVSDITYTFDVTNVFPTSGSLDGGTEVTITGSGFSPVAAQNIVSFGNSRCEVKSASTTEVVCSTTTAGRTHLVNNLGIHPEYYIGYEWNPKQLTVNIGDKVRFQWNTPKGVVGVSYGVHEIELPDSLQKKENGFSSGSTNVPNGAYEHVFMNEGTSYYFSDVVDQGGLINMRGLVKVIPRTSLSSTLNFTIAGSQAVYNTASGASDPANSDSCSPSTSAIAGCTDPAPSSSDSTKFSFGYWSCKTPVLSEISPLNGTVSTVITVTGTGFSTTKCQNEIMVGSNPCTVLTASATELTCNVSPLNEALVGTLNEVTFRVKNLGRGLLTATGARSSHFVLMPHVESVTPVSGSTAGGTRITVTGSGFRSGHTRITMGSLTCGIVSQNYTTLICDTPSGTDGTVASLTLLVHNGVQDVPAVCQDSTSSCEFRYLASLTPTVASVANVPITAGAQSITITGTNFGTSTDVTVKIGETPCSVTTIVDSSIVCNAGSPIVGSQLLSVHKSPEGLAASSVAFVSVEATAVTQVPVSGSVGGGTRLTLTGLGFLSGGTSVKIDGKESNIESVSPTQVVCITPYRGTSGAASVLVTSNGIDYPTASFNYDDNATPRVTAVSPSSGNSGDAIVLSGSGFGNNVNDVTVAIYNITCSVTTVTDTSITCTLGSHSAGTSKVTVVVKVKGLAYPTVDFTYALSVTSVSPNSGSFGGGQVATIIGNGFEAGATNVSICGNSCRVLSVTSTQITCRTPANSGSGTVPCTVSVTTPGASTDKANSYTFSDSLTPLISSTSPSVGGTGGGTVITISGSGFGTNSADITVHVGGVKCDVGTVSDSQVTCTTNARVASGPAAIELSVGSNGIAKTTTPDVGIFNYKNSWSSPATWGGTKPGEGSFVIITSVMTVYLDEDTPRLEMLLIQGGRLIFEDVDVELKANNILITDGGLLQVGTESAPFQKKAIITMFGHRRQPELPIYGAKTLAVRNGTLDLHGIPRNVMWTLLESTANAGDTTLTLRQSVDWVAGDEIVIASTGNFLSQSQNEKCTIASISADGRTLTLTKPLAHKHLGETLTFGDETLEGRAEVGILTHNVVFRGSDNTQWHDKIEACPKGFNPGEFATQTCFQGRFGDDQGSSGFGAQIMLHAGTNGKVVGRICGVELTFVGQEFRIGRYAIHFHLNGDMSGSYVKRSSIHNSNNRAINIHGSHNLLVEHNVVYNIRGGAFFLEDGVETGNVFQYNLAVFVISSTSLLNDDITPAAFWATNPNNTFQHNHAAGGTHFGFWYRMHEHPDGPSFDSNICPQKVPLGVFYNNTVHSQGWFGLWIFQSYHPTVTGKCGSTEPLGAKFRQLIAWNCDKGAEWVDGGAIQIVESRFFLNNVGIEMKLAGATPYNETSGAMLKNNVIAARSDSSTVGSPTTSVAIVLPYSGGLIVSGTKFINYDQPPFTALAVTSIQGKTEDDNGGFSSRFYKSNKINSPRMATYRWIHEAVFYDMDGTLTGTVNGKALPKSGILPSSCVPSAEFSYGLPGVICPAWTHFIRFSFNDAKPSSLNGKNITLTNSHGTSYAKYKGKRVTHKHGWQAILLAAETYDFAFENGEQFVNISYSGSFLELTPSQYVIMQHNFTQIPDRIFTRPSDKETRKLKATKVNYADDFDGDVSLEGTIVSTLVSDKDPSSKRRRKRDVSDSSTMRNRATKFNAFHCERKGCVEPLPPGVADPSGDRPSDFKLWSDEDTWVGTDPYGNGTHGLPVEGNNVTIKKDVWVVMDITPPDLNKVYIYGTLEFDPRKDAANSYMTLKLSATHIIIIGGRLIVGTEEEPFPGDATIEMRGNQFTTGLVMANGPAVGAMAIGNFGGLDLHGKGKTSWTKLKRTASSGNVEVSVSSPVDWLAGDQVVISTTSFDYTQDEIRTLASLSADGLTLTLTKPLTYNHVVNLHSIGGGETITLAGEVGRLSRNVRVVGKSYNSMTSDAFGARVLVGSYFHFDESTGVGTQNVGFARIEGVEFHQTGQVGYVEAYDPRFSLAYLNTGTSAPARPSYVKHCAFHHGFATAIGVFGATAIPIIDNVIWRTLAGGIVIAGEDIQLKHNLVTATKVPGLWNGRKEDIKYWDAGFELVDAVRLVLRDNVAAGSERVGFHVNGESCNKESLWSNNEVHSTLVGVAIFPTDRGVSGCALFNGFTVWNAFDCGMYLQTKSSIEVRNYTSIHNNLGLYPMVIGPGAVSHAFEDKKVNVTASRFVGYGGLSCDDSMPSDTNMAFSEQSRSWRTSTGGKVGMALGTLASGSNNAAEKPFYNLMTYNAIRGQTIIDGVIFRDFGKNCGNKEDVAITTNPSNDDGIHPTELRNVKFENVGRHNKLFFHRPNVGKINPSDCVDMDCDGLKKVLIRDTDGSLLGLPGQVFSQSEFEWDGDQRRGLGDYRIPKALLTESDGSRINADDIVPNKGIIRDPTCKKQVDWNAWQCHVYDYMMLMLESMDADSETRRVSPIGVKTGTYIDLVNGPQDHGWCLGYTCQKRLSLFPILVPMGKTTQLYFTGTSPQSLRFHLLNASPSKAFVAAVWYMQRQRIDVYVNGVYLPPLNVAYNSKGQQTLNEPKSPGQYIPDAANHPNGANYFERSSGLLYILVRGNIYVDTKMVPMVTVSFTMPAMTVDEFFGANIISNLAAFLNIPPEKIVISKAVREKKQIGRRKRSTEVTTLELQIVNQPTANGAGKADDLSYNTLQEKSAQLINAAALNMLRNVLQVEILGFSIEQPVPEPSSPAWKNLTVKLKNGTMTAANSVPLLHTLAIETHPVVVYEGLPFAANIHFLDVKGDHIDQVGAPLTSWKITASLNQDSRNIFNGTMRSTFGSKGYARFDDLAVMEQGVFYLNYTLSAPEYAIPLFKGLSKAIQVRARPFKVIVTEKPKSVNPGQPFDIKVFVYDEITKHKVANITWKHPDWTCELMLLNVITPFGNVTLSGAGRVRVTKAGGDVTFTGLTLDLAGQHMLRLLYRSTTGSYAFSENITVLVLPSDFQPARAVEVTQTVTLRLEGNYTETVAGREAQFNSAVYNALQPRDWGVVWGQIEATAGSIVVSALVNGSNSDVTRIVSQLGDDVAAKDFYILFDGRKLMTDGTMKVDNTPYAAKRRLSTGAITGIALGSLLVLVLTVVFIVLILKTTNKCKEMSGQKEEKWRSVSPRSFKSFMSGKEYSSSQGLVVSDMEIEIASSRQDTFVSEGRSVCGMGSTPGAKELYDDELPEEMKYTLLGAWGDRPGQRTPRTPRPRSTESDTKTATPPPAPVTAKAVQNAANAATKLRRRSISGQTDEKNVLP